MWKITIKDRLSNFKLKPGDIIHYKNAETDTFPEDPFYKYVVLRIIPFGEIVAGNDIEIVDFSDENKPFLYSSRLIKQNISEHIAKLIIYGESKI